MIYPVDLHIHSTASDGKLSPTELVQLAARKNIHAIALTDHDTINGLDEAIAVGKTHGVKVVTGVEFSTRHEHNKQFIGIHMLGYFFDHHSSELQAIMKKVQDARLEQKVKQIEKLQTFGFDLPVDEVLKRVSGVPGRPHIATVLMERNPGRFANRQQVFDEFLGSGKRAHVGRTFALTVAESVELISSIGGLPVLAHPGVYSNEVDVDELIENAVAAGIKGLEVYYSYRESQGGKNLIAHFESVARRHNLFMTGGTDYHGRLGEVFQLGEMGLSLANFEAIEAVYG